jgi:hypothetical protein
MEDDMVDNGYDEMGEIVDSNDEPFIGGVDAVSNDGENDVEFVEMVAPPPNIPRFTAFVGNSSQPRKRRGRPPKAESEKLTAFGNNESPPRKRKGRPPKAESEKKRQTPAQPKGALRISLTPKPKAPRGRPPRSSLTTALQTTPGDPTSVSPFPVVQLNNAVKKCGRPRIHPPKDPSVKKPRGRPRLIPLEGEKAWRTECAKLRRLLTKKDELITRMKQKLKELGVTLDEQLPKTSTDSDNNDYSVDANGVDDDCGGGGEDVDSSIAAVETVPCTIENTHQKYLDIFAAENYDENDDDSNSVASSDNDAAADDCGGSGGGTAADADEGDDDDDNENDDDDVN